MTSKRVLTGAILGGLGLVLGLATPGDVAASTDPASDVEALAERLEREERRNTERAGRATVEAERLRQRVRARGRAYVKLTRVGLLPAVGGLEQLVDHARRVEALRQTLERDLDRVQKLDRERAALGEKLAELREQRDSVEAQRRAMAQARQVLLAARDRELAFERAFSGAGSDHTAIYGAAASPSDSSDPTAGFAGMRGRLPFPLPGRVEVRRAHAPSGGGAGLEMTAPNGTAVRAVGPGRVAFADEYPDYGRSVIVDHGGGYFTVSARLDALDVRAGDDVSAGSRIGSIGGLAPGATLYFEVRSGMDTLDPSEWFGI